MEGRGSVGAGPRRGGALWGRDLGSLAGWKTLCGFSE